LRFEQRAAAVALFVLDVDGVLTDGTLLDVRGTACRRFHTQDGIGMILLDTAGIRTVLVTGKQSYGLRVRAREVRCRHVYQGVKDKVSVVNRLCRMKGLSWRQVAYMGDDLPDLPVMKLAGLAIAPANAVAEVRNAADIVTRREGGAGAVREAAELLLKGRGAWEDTVSRYLRSLRC